MAISIHAPHTGRDVPVDWAKVCIARISIHAPHTGRDYWDGPEKGRLNEISIHAPHTGRDCSVGICIPGSIHFNPRAPYVARPAARRPTR